MTTAAITGNTSALHRMGESVADLHTAEEVLHRAGLADWDVRKVPLVIPSTYANGETITVPGKYATVRDNIAGGVDVLGVVGEKYTVIQNEQTAAILNAIVDESGAVFETAGELNGGRRTFVSMRLPETVDLVGTNGLDPHEWYMSAFNSHDGNGALSVTITPMRVYCANMQRAALRGAVSSWSIRHTFGASAAIDEARRALGLTFRYMEAFNAEAAAMIQRQIDEDEARRLLREVFDVEQTEPDSRIRASRELHVEDCLALLDSRTNANIAGSRYALYNAVTEHVDHGWPLRGRSNDDRGVLPSSALAGRFADLKARAFDLIAA